METNTNTKPKRITLNDNQKDKLRELGKILLQSVISILIALVIGAIIILILGENPLFAYGELFKGAFNNSVTIANTFSKAVPLIFTGLAVAISLKAGMLNIGAEGQLYLGAMASAICALYVGNLSPVIAIPLCILAGFIGGALGGLLAGFLRSKFMISEVIAAIMLNYIFKLLTSYLAAGPFSSGESVVQTPKIGEGAWLTTLVPGSKLTTAILLAVVAAIIIHYFLTKTSPGFKLRAVGDNRTAAASGGIKVKWYMLLAMGLSGGLAGLAGTTEVLGTYHRFIEGFSPSFGFTGIAVAILARNNPFAVILSALLFAILDTGSLRMARTTNISSNVVVVIQSLIIIAVSAPEMIKFVKKRKKVAKEEKEVIENDK